MKKGKVSESVLKRSVFKYIDQNDTAKDDWETDKGAARGLDCAFFKWQNRVLAASVQTVTLPVRGAGSMAVLAAANNLAAGGMAAAGVMLSLTLPVSAEEADLKNLMQDTAETCRKLGLSVWGGHTEVSEAVLSPVITATAVATVEAATEAETDAAETRAAVNPTATTAGSFGPGLSIVMTKWAGLEGAVILSREKEAELRTRYPAQLLWQVQNLAENLSVKKEAAIAGKSGVYAMHDIRNGGVFAGLYELAKSMGVGLSVDLKKIPVKQEVIEICEFFDLNPYELLSGGSLLLVTDRGEELAELLREAGIAAEVIGETTSGNDKIVTNGDEIRYLEPAKPDEIFKIKWN